MSLVSSRSRRDRVESELKGSECAEAWGGTIDTTPDTIP